jgi:hypothetical protein
LEKEKSKKKRFKDFYLNGGTYDEKKEIYFGDSVGKEKIIKLIWQMDFLNTEVHFYECIP